MAIDQLDPALVEVLADRAKEPNYDEWSACFFVALDGGRDWREAVALADEVAPGICEPAMESLLEAAEPRPADQGVTRVNLEHILEPHPEEHIIESVDPNMRNREAWAKVDPFPEQARPELTPAEQAALTHYSGTGYENINGALRGKEAANADTMQHLGNLHSAMRKATPFAEPIEVTRGLDLAPEQLEEFRDKLERTKDPGAALRVKGFVSTSRDPKQADTFAGGGLRRSRVMLTIRARKGISMIPHSSSAGEQELLLPHESYFRTAETRHDPKTNTFHATLEHLPHAPKGAAIVENRRD